MILARAKKMLASLALAGILASAFLAPSASYTYAQTNNELVQWNLTLDAPVPMGEVNAMGGEAQAGMNLLDVLNAKFGGSSTAYDVQVADLTEESVQYQVNLQAQSTIDEFRQTVYATLAPEFDYLGGVIFMNITGQVVEGQELTVTLESRPGTGYTWELTNADAGLVEKIAEPEMVMRGGFPGAPAREVIRLRALTSGEVQINLVYHRLFEVDAAAVRRVDLQVGTLSDALDLSSPLDVQEIAMPDLPEAAPLDDVQAGVGAEALPSSFDWRSSGKLTAVRNQGPCGSCWAFGTVGVMEAALLIAGGGAKDFSEQFLISCSNFAGCGGGWWAHDLHTNVLANKQLAPGTVFEADKPYTATNGTCDAAFGHPYKLSEWHYVGGAMSVPSVDSIKTAIYNNGPVAAAVCSGTNFYAYTGGVLSANDSCTYDVNHAIVIVGWDDAQGAWIVRNSWGATWGESGYLRIKYGVSNVGYGASYVRMNSSASTCYSVNTGNVTGGSVTINRAPNCNGTQYGAGTPLTITATADDLNKFVGWSGDVTGTQNPLTLTVDKNYNIQPVFEVLTAPANDDFGSAVGIDEPGGLVDFYDTQYVKLATKASDDPAIGSLGALANSVWYKFTPIASGTLKLDTKTSNYDTVLAVWTGSRGSLKLVKSNDNYNGSQSYTYFNVTPGTTYFVEVASRSANPDQLKFHLNFKPTSPSNNNFDYAVTVPSSAAAFTYNKVQDVFAASSSSDDPNFTTELGRKYKTVWYKFRPLAPGTLVVDTIGSNYNTVVGVWRGSRGSLRAVGVDDNSGGSGTSRLQVDLVTGITYYIEVASFNSIDLARMNLNLSFTPKAALGLGKVEQNDSRLVYLGTWASQSLSGASGGSVMRSTKTNSYAGFAFNGDRLTLTYSRVADGGVMSVYIDGVLQANINQKGTVTDQLQWSSAVLSTSGPHMVLLRHYSGTAVNLDAVEVRAKPPTIGAGYYEEDPAVIAFKGYWQPQTGVSGASVGGHVFSRAVNDYALFYFSGSKLNIIYSRLLGAGTLQVYVDGVLVKTINQSATTPMYQVTYSRSVTPGTHKVMLKHYSGGPVYLDAVEILP